MQFVQITYLIVSCVPNSNFSSLYIQIGEAIDWALGYGSPIYEELIRRCRTLADKQLKVCELIEKLAIGTIILDEIQLIDFTSNKENSYEGLLAIVNKTKVALSVVGTDEAYQSLFSKLRNARRSGDYINASEYCKSEEFFDNLTKTLFMWQWFDDKVEWTKELSKALYVASKGLINQLIWIYKWMNLEYLDGKSKGKAPEINPSFVEKINKKHFGHLKNHLDLLKQIESERLNDQSIIAEAHKVNMKPIENEEALTLTKVQSEVVKIIRPLFPNFEVNMIEGAVKQLLSGEDLKTISIDELARNTLRTLQNKPIKKKIKRTTTKTNSKDICAYL